jgi:hypothetical protein
MSKETFLFFEIIILQFPISIEQNRIRSFIYM